MLIPGKLYIWNFPEAGRCNGWMSLYKLSDMELLREEHYSSDELPNEIARLHHGEPFLCIQHIFANEYEILTQDGILAGLEPTHMDEFPEWTGGK